MLLKRLLSEAVTEAVMIVSLISLYHCSVRHSLGIQSSDKFFDLGGNSVVHNLELDLIEGGKQHLMRD